MSTPPTERTAADKSNSILGDIQSPGLIWLKGILFVGLGLLAAGVLFLRHPGWTEFFLLVTAIWAFCRAYYFAFYVVEHYIDSDYKFDGLYSVIRYALRRKNNQDSHCDDPES